MAKIILNKHSKINGYEDDSDHGRYVLGMDKLKSVAENKLIAIEHIAIAQRNII